MQANNNQVVLFIIITTAIIFLLASLIITLLYFYQKKKIAHEKSLNSLKLDFDKTLLTTQLEIQEQTFSNISREIHDNIGLSLTLAKLNLSTLDWLDVEATYKAVKVSTQIIGSAIADLGNLSKSMSPEMIRNIGLMKALKIEVEKLIDMAHLRVSFEVRGEPVFMDSEKELIIFRIIQEAFNNILKHAQACKVWLQLNYSFGYLDILVKDNGIGFARDETTAHKKTDRAGLVNMQARAKLLGGRFTIESKEKKGTQILITVPYR